MRLIDVWNSTLSRARNIGRIFFDPLYVLRRQAERGVERLGQVEARSDQPMPDSSSPSSPPSSSPNQLPDRSTSSLQSPTTDSQLRTKPDRLRKAASRITLRRISQTEKTVHLPSPPSHPSAPSHQAQLDPFLGKEIQRRGRYQFQKKLDQNNLDLPQTNPVSSTYTRYEGRTQGTQTVWINVYELSPKEFSPDEITERKQKFERINHLRLQPDRGKDFRLVSLREAIADQKEPYCYLITDPIEHGITLREYLSSQPTSQKQMSPERVRQVLDQVLQTLRFLHTQVYDPIYKQWGLVHGNISFDSLWIVEHQSVSDSNRPGFWIYVTDLALWEDLFRAPAQTEQKQKQLTPKRDLHALGEVAKELLKPDSNNNSMNEQKLQSDDKNLNLENLELFIQQLIDS
ncbi:protein kinase family protein [Thermocoleostomius sinensis]|uniref:Protein kinase domain-containing protein n=1 Tax=Thermocoleostomius sinensis A174 TaxID=2016057 RepID=A0A9E9C4I5_9CYAN|nr:hypothetical protein [Thermocoleostomius sinensis]WAL60091.1 hypothetical protein OXH18_23450 [Thermocoleostomius sinensis A174]